MELNELSKDRKTLIISSKDISRIVKEAGPDNLMKKIITVVEKGFEDFQTRKIKVPKRNGLYFSGGLVEAMPVYDERIICYKIGSVYKNNHNLNLPSTLAHLVLLDRDTGYPLAFIEDTLITALRTGAASCIATKYLADRNSRSIGLIGAGVQAYTQLHAIALVMPNLKTAYIYDKNPDKSRKFIDEYKRLKISGSKLEFIISSNPRQLCQNSDIIITATTKSNDDETVVKHSWVKEGTHINAIGTDTPKKGGYTEVELKLLRKSKIVVDYMEQALNEGESQNLKKEEIYAELGEIISGKKEGRISEKEITIFDSTGVAFQDLVAVRLFLDANKTAIKFCSPKNTSNPYIF